MDPIYLSVFLSAIVTVTQGRVLKAIKWGYGDFNGPEQWPELFPDKCAGTFQSPVDIRPLETFYNRYLTPFNIYEPPPPHAKYTIQNNGKSIQVDTQGIFLLDNGGLRHTYKIEQFHFHWGDSAGQGAEHTIYETAESMEMHIVSWNVEKYKSYVEASQSPDGLVVLGILFNVSFFDNPVMEGIVQAIPRIRDPDLKNKVDIQYIPLVEFLPNSPEKYFRYRGSLTTPNCYESVIWTVFKERQYISERQVNTNTFFLI
ncbi:carbonic anhydrase 1-like [Ruditapes philippinarum]|uniref:carbonic anhydrase 1-like n=1 Tax=Ruditapes philippinarum TaxID=129788 RepID=UPI00295C0A7A|nr:carbonic anhydrase 1-like [Ruditapes philippinarum]